MAVNAYLVIRDADADGAGRLDRFYKTRNEAVARAATDAALSPYPTEVSVSDRVTSGWWFDGTDTLTSDRPFTNAARDFGCAAGYEVATQSHCAREPTLK